MSKQKLLTTCLGLLLAVLFSVVSSQSVHAQEGGPGITLLPTAEPEGQATATPTPQGFTVETHGGSSVTINVTCTYQTYIVQTGDTLSGIASKYGTSYNQIMAQSGLQTTVIRIGQVLCLPPGSGAQPTAYATANAAQPGTATATATRRLPGPVATSVSRLGCPNPYVVKAGDTLSGIARDASISVVGVWRANGGNPNQLRVGETVCRQQVLAGVAVTSPQGATGLVVGQLIADAAAVTIGSQVVAQPAETQTQQQRRGPCPPVFAESQPNAHAIQRHGDDAYDAAEIVAEGYTVMGYYVIPGLGVMKAALKSTGRFTGQLFGVQIMTINTEIPGATWSQWTSFVRESPGYYNPWYDQPSGTSYAYPPPVCVQP